jgi:hypothetical protein
VCEYINTSTLCVLLSNLLTIVSPSCRAHTFLSIFLHFYLQSFLVRSTSISTIPFIIKMQFTLSFILVALTSIPTLVTSHGVLTEVKGANGVVGQGFGVLDTTPRTGSGRNPFQV